MLAGSFPRNIEAHPGSDHSCLPNHLSPSLRRSHLLQARRYEDILRSRPRVRARLRRTGPVPVFVLELRAAEGYQSNVFTLDFPTVLSVLRLHCPGSILHALAAAPLVLSPERGFFYTPRA
jgi:hypothetical protein